MSNPVDDLLDEVGCFNLFDRSVMQLRSERPLPPCVCVSCLAERHYTEIVTKLGKAEEELTELKAEANARLEEYENQCND
jgi:hypothetical protein